jgi:hypothetical protein
MATFEDQVEAAMHAIHDIDCDGGKECHEVLDVKGRYGRYAKAAMVAARTVATQHHKELAAKGE